MMSPLQTEVVVKSVLAQLPDEVTELLSEVDTFVCREPLDASPKHFDKEAKGVFDGVIDEGLDDEDSHCEPPTGTIWLFASNLDNPGDARDTYLHEIGHALGMDEHEVEGLGL